MFRDLLLRASVDDLYAASSRYETFDGKKAKSFAKRSHLKRILKLFDLVMLSICAAVGSGIYIMPGTAGKFYTGSSLVISVLLGGISCVAITFSYAEFSSRIPLICNSYIINYTTSGEFIAFFFCWTRLSTLLVISINALAAIGYFESFLLTIFDMNTNSIWFGYKPLDSTEIISINILAPCLVILLSLFVISGVNISSHFWNLLTVWNVSLLLLCCVAGLYLIDTDIWINPCDHIEFDVSCPSDANNSFFAFGFEGVMAGTAITIYAFAGVEAAALASEESINPVKDVPRAIIIATFLIAMLYTFIVMVLNGLVPFQAFDEDAPISEAFAVHNEKLLTILSSLGAATTMTLNLFAALFGASRNLFRFSIDGMLPSVLSYIYPRTSTPIYAILLYCFVSCVISLCFNISSLLEFASIANILEYISILCSLLIVRYAPANNDKYNNWRQQNSKDSFILITTNNKFILFVWCYVIIALVICFLINNGAFDINNDSYFLFVALILFGLILIFMIFVFLYNHYKLPWKEWISTDGNNTIVLMPFVPYLPLIILFVNVYIMSSFGIIFFVQVTGFYAFGVVWYFSYSYHHSYLRKRRQNQQNDVSLRMRYGATFNSTDEHY